MTDAASAPSPADALGARVVRTPLLVHRSDSRERGDPILLKPETLQPFGSYKIRGVLAAIRAADPATLQRGLFAASAGNMGQAVAFAAQVVGCPCRIFVPDTAPEIKKAAIRRLGADLVEMPFDRIWGAVLGDDRLPAEGLFIHPARTPGLTSGYGAIAEEILADRPDVGAVVAPFGLGGLALGVARAFRALRPQTEVFLVEPETAAPMAASLAAGSTVAVTRTPSFVDAIGTPEVLKDVFEALEPLVAGARVVTIREAEAAVARLFRADRLIVEGAGACAFAAAANLAREGRGPVVAILSGANLEESTLLDILRRHTPVWA